MISRRMTIFEQTTLDLAIQTQAMQIETELLRLHANNFLPVGGRCLPHRVGVGPGLPADRQTLQGGLDRTQQEPHKLTKAGSTPAPATNPNAGCYGQVNPYTGGRW